VDQRITCSAWFPGRPEVCGDVSPRSQTSDGLSGRLEVTPAVWYNFQTSDSQRMTNPNTCAQPTLLLQYGQSTKEEGESGTHLSDVCMITQTSTLPSGYQSRRLILEIFPESEPRSASARDAARVAPRASAAPPAAGPSPRRSAPPAPSAGRPSRSRRARPHGRAPPSHAAAPPRLLRPPLPLRPRVRSLSRTGRREGGRWWRREGRRAPSPF